jgi:nucleotide-binding universal stress UspA family protein
MSQEVISINDQKAWELFHQYMLKMAVEGLIKIKRFDGYYGEFEVEYKDYHDVIRYEEWQLEEVFQNGIPTSYEEFKRSVIMYLEGEIRKKQEEARKKEENKKLANDLLNALKTYIEEYEKAKNIKVKTKVEGGDTWGAITLYIEPNTPDP